MKKLKMVILVVCLISSFSAFAMENKGPRIYLYGEDHGQKIQYEEELKAWQNFYNNQNMRHLFIESGYSTAQMLNQWMKAEDDSILLEIYENWKGTQAYTQSNLDFYKRIKQTCPETIFHGTDVGHQYSTNDRMLLRQLEEKGLTDCEEYKITLLNITQAMDYYGTKDYAVRENYMAANFIREFDSLPENEKIMGIYGAAHVFYEKDITGKVPSMIKQIRKNYKNSKELIEITDISYLKTEIEPLGTDEFKIKGKVYKASYFGEEDLTGFRDFKYRKYWRIESPDEKLMKLKAKIDCLPYDNYIMPIKIGDILRVEYTKLNGSKFVVYYRADGKMFEGQLCTNRIFKE